MTRIPQTIHWHQKSTWQSDIPFWEVRKGSQKQQADDVPVHCEHESVGSIAQSHLGNYEVYGVPELGEAQGQRYAALAI